MKYGRPKAILKDLCILPGPRGRPLVNPITVKKYNVTKVELSFFDPKFLTDTKYLAHMKTNMICLFVFFEFAIVLSY